MFNRYPVVLAISLWSLSSAANAANPLTDYPNAKPGDAGYIAEDPQLAHLAGMPGPSITLRSIDGGTIDIVKNYGHKPVYLKLWASYCIPCRAQMPGFEKIYEAYGNRMQIIAVNAGVGDDPAKVRLFASETKMRMPVAIDDGTLGAWLKMDSTPFSILIGLDGRVAYAGHQDGPPLDAAIQQVLAGTATRTRIETTRLESIAKLKPGDLVPLLNLRGGDNSSVELGGTGHPRAVLFTAVLVRNLSERHRTQDRRGLPPGA